MGEHILVVDDDELVRASLELEAEEAGYRVATAADGFSALELARFQRFDLVVCDIRMPGMDGLEVIEQLKKSQPHAGYIVITGYASPDTPVRALKMKVDDYLLKPFDGPAFLASVRQVLVERERGAQHGRNHQEALLGILRATLDDSARRIELAEFAARRASESGFSARRIRTVYLCGLLNGVDRGWLSPFAGLRRVTSILEGEESGLESRVLEQAVKDFSSGTTGEFSLPEADWVGLENLIRLANKHRALGHWTQADALYERVLQSGLSEESELEVKLEQFLLSIQRGEPRSSLGQEVRLGARSLGLKRLEAKAALHLARLRECPTDELVKAREVFADWDDLLEWACSDLLLQHLGDERAEVSRHDADLLKQAFGVLPEANPAVEEQHGDCQVKLFGPFRVLSQGSHFPDEDWVSRKDRMLFAYLCAHAGKIVTEESLLELLWSCGGEKARHSLHNSVSQTRRVLSKFSGLKGKEIIERAADGYRLGSRIEVDLKLFEECFEKGTRESLAGAWDPALLLLQRADRQARGDFMEGDYQEWTFPLREEVEGRLVDLLATLAGYFAHRGKREKAGEYWQRVLELDRCNEQAYECLLRLHGELKQSAEAHKLYLAAEGYFEEILGVSVPSRLAQVYRKICDGSLR
ncbi:MAG: response regulator [Vulcanimicrobiota bacterium]